MESFNNLSVGAKLWAGVTVVIVALIVVITMTGVKTANLSQESDQALVQMSEKMQLATRWVGLIQTNVTRVQASVLSSDPAVGTLYKDQIAATIKEITEVQNKIVSMQSSPAESALLDRIASSRKAVLESLAKARELKGAGNAEAAINEITTRFNPALVPYYASLDEFAKLQSSILEEAEKGFADRRHQNVTRAAIVFALLVLFIAIGSYYLIRNIREPLQQAIGFSQQFASGDLTAKLQTTRADEFGAMTRALMDMRGQIARVVSDVRRGTDNITEASQEIATGNNDLSARTEQTASNLQQTAASMEEMAGAIKQSAESARIANQLATTATTNAGQGGQIVDQVISTMDEINQASRKINDIIGVIDGIAFQTNILALNAAVEAARAGEQGRGFAVVAGEVRSLAGRSAEAAKEIKALIGNSVEKVTAGSTLVNQAGASMKEIVDNVTRVRDIIGEIATSASQQADGINQINAAISNLDQMTQQNAALVEESAAAASSMSDQAAQLSQVVKTFRIDHAEFPSSGIANLPPRDLQKSRPAPPATAQSRVTVPAVARTQAPRAAAPRLQTNSATKAEPAEAGTRSKDDWETF